MHRRLALLAAVLALGTPLSQAAQNQPETPAKLTLTLEEALDLARAQNLTLLAARQDIKRTRGVLREGYATAYPNVTATGSYTRTDESSISSIETAEGPLTFGTDETYAYALGLEQRLYSGILASREPDG